MPDCIVKIKPRYNKENPEHLEELKVETQGDCKSINIPKEFVKEGEED